MDAAGGLEAVIVGGADEEQHKHPAKGGRGSGGMHEWGVAGSGRPRGGAAARPPSPGP